MKDMRIVATAIKPDILKAELNDFACGALVIFEGWIRNHNKGRAVRQLEYEVYIPLAIKEGQRVLDQAGQIYRFPIVPPNFHAANRSRWPCVRADPRRGSDV